MSDRYLLPCQCGQAIPVAPSQAGGSVTCESCGTTFEAPRLRELRELPLAPTSEPAKGSWGFRQGLVTAGLLLGAALAGGAGWFKSIEPDPPKPLDVEARAAVVDSKLESMQPVELWRLYVQAYAPLATQGLQPTEDPRAAYIERLIATSRLYQRALLYGAAGVVVAALAAAAMTPK